METLEDGGRVTLIFLPDGSYSHINASYAC